jgi:site-specific recombinase XerD
MSKAPETLTFDESEKLLNHLKNTAFTSWSKWRNIRNHTMALIMLDAGLRVGELVRLTVRQLIFSGEPVKSIDAGEGIAEKKCERIIPVSVRTSAALSKMNQLVWSARPEIENGFAFFENNCFEHLSTRQVERIIYAASIAAIGRGIHPHVLRHTFATRLMRVTSTRVVQQLLGHKHLNSTERYTHPNGDDCKKAIDELSGR